MLRATLGLISITILTVTSVPGFGQTVTPTTPGPDSTAFAAGVTQLRNVQASSSAAIGAAQQQLARPLERPVNADDVADLRRQLAAAVDRLNALERLRLEQYRADVNQLATRHDIGITALEVIIANSGKLALTTDLLQNQSQFNALANPMENATFANAIQGLRNRLPNESKSLPFADKLHFTNPFLSAAWSIGSMLFADVNKDNKLTVFRQTECVVDFATRAASDKATLDAELSALQEHSRGLNNRAKALFTRYAARVGYNKTWEQYRAEATAQNPLRDASKQFFTRFSGVTAAPAVGTEDPQLANIRFDIESVRDLLADYDLVLTRAETYIGNYAAMIERHKDFECASMANLKTQLETLASSGRASQQKFRDEYLSDIPVSVRATLMPR